MKGLGPFAAWLTRLLMLGYPRAFRRRYCHDMALFWAAERSEARYAGAFGGPRFVTEIAFDIITSACRQRLRQVGASLLSVLRGPAHGTPSPALPSPTLPSPPRGNTMDNLLQDLRYALRALVQRPGWTLAAVATLGLGIGATTAIFGLVNDVILRPLPYPEPDRIVTFRAYIPEIGRLRGSVSYPVYELIDQAQDVVEGLGCYSVKASTVDFGAGAERMIGAVTSWQALAALSTPPAHGRLFQTDDDLPGAGDTVVLSHGLWQERFGGEVGVIGRTVEIAERIHTVIGVMPEGFLFPDHGVRYWTSMAGQPRVATRHYLSMVGRLSEGLDPRQAQAQIDSLRLTVPTGAPGRSGEIEVRMETLLTSLVGDLRPQLLLFLGAVAALLLIASINVVNLILSRTAARRRELSLRAALGAGRLRLVRQLVTETTLLGLLGGVTGAFLAFALSKGLLALAPADLPRGDLLGLDPAALSFAVALSIVVGALIGFVPALRHVRLGLQRGLHAGAPGAADSGRDSRLRNALVVAQVALALVLLVGAGLLAKSFQTLSAIDLGFTTAQILTFRPALAESLYPSSEAGEAFYTELVARLGALPGVRDVALTETLPFGGHIGETFLLEDWPEPDERDEVLVDVQVVDPAFFRLLEIPLLSGRALAARDQAGAPAVAVVNQTLARRYFQDRDAVGERIRVGSYGDERWLEIVGVVPDIRPYRLVRDVEPMVYEALAQADEPWGWGVGVMIGAGERNVAALTQDVRDLVRSIDPGVPLIGLRTLEERIDRDFVLPRFRALLLSAFGIAALMLAVIGVYGVMAYGVVLRTREIGVRMAVGAERAHILRWIACRGARLTVLGLALGLLGAWLGSDLLAHYLYGTTPYDVAIFALAALALAGAALLASYLPARRASLLDPTDALRAE